MLGVGLLISTAVKTQTQAMQLSIFYLLPSILLTGFMFPPEAMPLFCRGARHADPHDLLPRGRARHRAQGSGLAQLWQPAAILTAFALLLVTVSVKRFSKTME